MTTIYVVQQGEYSDYSVVGVFSKREYADRIAKVVDEQSTQKTEVKEWQLDPYIDEMGKGCNQYRITLLQDGGAEEIVRKKPGYRLEESGSYTLSRVNQFDTVPKLYVTIWAANDVDALAEALVVRDRLLTEGKWFTGNQ